MSDLLTQTQPAEMTLEAVVIRCTCGAPARHPGVPCPQGRRESLGTLAYWHRNPVRRLAHWLRHRRHREEI